MFVIINGFFYIDQGTDNDFSEHPEKRCEGNFVWDLQNTGFHGALEHQSQAWFKGKSNQNGKDQIVGYLHEHLHFGGAFIINEREDNMLVIFHSLAAAPEHDPHVAEDRELIAPREGLTEEVAKDNRRHKTQEKAYKDQTW